MFDSNIGFPGGSRVKNLPANAEDTRDVVLIPGLGRSPGGENGNPLQYPYLENSMDRGAWWASVCGIAKTPTQLREWAHTHTHTHTHTEQYSFLKATAFERVLRVRNTVIFSQVNKRMEKFATEQQPNVRLLSLYI